MRSINPLNVLDQREVVYPPEHFTKIYYDISVDKAVKSINTIMEEINSWIFNNLDGRYYIKNNGLENNKSLLTFYYRFEIGFEIPEESTFFSLAFEL